MTDVDREMVTLWRGYRPTPGKIIGMAAGVVPVPGYLPESGGFGDQAAVMVDAFGTMDEAEAHLAALEG